MNIKGINRFSRGKNSWFYALVRWLILVTLVITMLCSLLFGFHLIDITTDQLNKSNFSALIYTCEQTYRNAHNALLIAMSVQLDDLIARNYADAERITLENRKEIVSKLSHLITTNTSLHSVYVWYNDAQLIYTSDGAFPKHSFRDLDWIDMATAMQEQKHWMPTRTIHSIVPNLDNQEVITLITAAPISRAERSGFVVINMYADQFFSYVHSDSIKIFNDYAVYDSDGILLYPSTENQIIEAKTHIDEALTALSGEENTLRTNDSITYKLKDSHFGWQFVAVYSINALNLQLQDYFVRILILCLSLIAVFCVLNYFLAHMLYTPMRELLSELTAGNDRQFRYEEFETLSASFRKMFLTNTELISTINDMLPRLRRRLFADILSQYYDDNADVLNQMQTLQIDPQEYAQYLVLIVSIDEPDRFLSELTTKEQIVTGHSILFLLDKILQPHSLMMIYSETRKYQFAVLIGFPKSFDCRTHEDARLNHLLRLFLSQAKDTLGSYTVSISVGSLFEQPINAVNSYADALLAQQMLNTKSGLSYYNSAKTASLRHIEPQTRQRFSSDFLDALTKRRHDLLYAALMTLRVNLNEHSPFVEDLQRQLVCLLAENLDASGILLENQQTELNRIASILISPNKIGKAAMKTLSDFCQHLCSLGGIVQIKHSKLLETIYSYIKTNYSRDVGLNDVAAAIGYTPAYINRILRNNVGSTFYETLTQYRISEAQKLLSETTLSVEDIAARVGYVNTRSFLRMYKKATHCTPTQYRERRNG